jgi:hypothetical protein
MCELALTGAVYCIYVVTIGLDFALNSIVVTETSARPSDDPVKVLVEFCEICYAMMRWAEHAARMGTMRKACRI